MRSFGPQPCFQLSSHEQCSKSFQHPAHTLASHTVHPRLEVLHRHPDFTGSQRWVEGALILVAQSALSSIFYHLCSFDGWGTLPLAIETYIYLSSCGRSQEYEVHSCKRNRPYRRMVRNLVSTCRLACCQYLQYLTNPSLLFPDLSDKLPGPFGICSCWTNIVSTLLLLGIRSLNIFSISHSSKH
jgi:hypothetical protein